MDDKIPQNIPPRAAAIELIVFDVDGVLTDGRLCFGADGGEMKCFDVKDGHGICLLHEHGIRVAVASARDSAVVARRMAELGVTHLYQGCRDKAAVLDALLVRFNLAAEQTAFMGDDAIDLPAMARAGLALAPADAHREVLRRADWVAGAKGGRGAAREACDLLLAARARRG